LAQEPVRALGDLQLAPALLQLTGPAGVSSVEPLVMRLLLLLSAQPDMVLARETLIAQLWPKTVVGEDSLHRAIGQARRALAGCGSAASIVTVPRIGYRLCLDAQQDPAPSAVAVADGAAAADPARRRWLVGAVLAGAAGLGGLALWSQRAATPQRPPMVSALLTNSLAQRRLAEPDAERQGVELLREAVKHAPDDAELWGQLALALRAVAEYAPPPRVAAALSEVEVAARRALALDRGQADARAALVMLQPLHGNWLAAERGFTAILADAPDHLPSLDGLSQVQASAGLLALHYPSRLRTVALDPLHAGYNFRAIYAHWMNGHIAAADRAGARGLELWPRHAATWNARFGLFGMTGRAERALAMLADEASRPRLPPPYLAMLKTVAGALAGGDGKDRDGAVDRVTAVLAGGGPFMAVMGSMWLAALGAPDRSLQVIEAFLLERGPMMVEPNWRPGQFLHNDVRRRFTNFLFTPVMAPVQALPDFDAVTEAIGLNAYWQSSGHEPEHRRR
jgi:DNA-binding winged helix-turn-helix (wHTH) protein